MNKYLLTEKEYGCGAILVDGYPCTSLGKDPNLCSECIKRLVSDFEAQDRKSRRMMLEWGTGNCTNPEHLGFKSHWHRFKCLECMAELEEELR